MNEKTFSQLSLPRIPGIKSLPLEEKDIKRQIVQWFQLKTDCFIWVNVSTGIYSPKDNKFRKLNGFGMMRGVSDILGIFRRKPLAIEVKRPGGKLSVYQNEFLKSFNAKGGIGFKASSIEDCVKELKTRGFEIEL